MIRFFASHPTAANLLMVALVAIGLLSVGNLRRETFPHFAARKVEVRVVYPGAAAEEVEDAICRRIEDALERVDDSEEMISEAREGVGLVVVEMASTGDLQVFLDDIRSEIDAIDDWPALAEAPVIVERGRTDRVISVAKTWKCACAARRAWAWSSCAAFPTTSCASNFPCRRCSNTD